MKRVTIRNIHPATWQTIRRLRLATGTTVAEVIEACIRFGSAKVIEEFATAKKTLRGSIRIRQAARRTRRPNSNK